MLHRLPTSHARLGTFLIVIAIVAKVLFIIVLAWNSRFVMDEFWHMSQPNYLGNGFFDTIQPEKAIGYAVFFKLAHVMANDSAGIMLTGRMLSVGLALALVAITYAHARRLRLAPIEAGLAILILMSFSNFMERSFELRSEPLAILLSATGLLVVMRGTTDSTRRLFFAGVLCGLSFVTTQKSVYFNVALGAGLVVDALIAGRHAAMVHRGGMLLLGWAAVVGIYAVSFGGLNPGPVLKALFLGPLEVAASAQDYYGNLRVYVVQTLLRNAPLYLFCVIGLALEWVRLRQADSSMRVHVIFTTITTVLVFAHNQPWPYVFSMALPFLAPYSITALKKIATRMLAKSVMLIVLILFTAASFQRNIIYLERSNVDQLALLREAERILPPGGTYFDGTGMLPARRMEPYIWLDAMGVEKTLQEGESGPFARAFLDAQPDLVILTYRTDALLPILGQVLADQYERASIDLMVKGSSFPRVKSDPKVRRDLFEAVYSF
jgi:hypothetical protein